MLPGSSPTSYNYRPNHKASLWWFTFNFSNLGVIISNLGVLISNLGVIISNLGVIISNLGV